MPMSSLRWAEQPPPPKNGRDADDETDRSREQFPSSIPHFSVLYPTCWSGFWLIIIHDVSGYGEYIILSSVLERKGSQLLTLCSFGLQYVSSNFS